MNFGRLLLKPGRVLILPWWYGIVAIRYSNTRATLSLNVLLLGTSDIPSSTINCNSSDISARCRMTQQATSNGASPSLSLSSGLSGFVHLRAAAASLASPTFTLLSLPDSPSRPLASVLVNHPAASQAPPEASSAQAVTVVSTGSCL
jgi:hypothetical protein